MTRKTRSCGNPPLKLKSAVSLEEFYSRLHQSIGGDGPQGIAWGGTPPSTDDPLFRENYLWSEIASKFDPGGSKDHLEAEAILQFRESERTCGAYNELLSSGAYRGLALSDKFDGLTLDAVFHTASRKIEGLLGQFCWKKARRCMGFGPGASFLLTRDEARIWNKLGQMPDVSVHATEIADDVLSDTLWKRVLERRFVGLYSTHCLNRITSVPKDYKKNRVIAIESLLGMFFQKGIGGLMRQSLKRVGIDLNDQGRNQLAAFVGSVDGSLSTIDLKAASDSISHELVRQLLPPDWLAALEQVRASAGVLDSGRHREIVPYQKFSSMGNGATFELETLIFWGICSSVLSLTAAEDRRLLVYGDDIVVPSASADLVVHVLQRCGFTPNAKKTHTAGPFRESCGKHFLSGVDVTPFYIRRPITDLGELFLLHNNLVRWAARASNMCAFPYRDARVRDLAQWLRSHAPEHCRKMSIPDGFGDNAFIGDFDECTPEPYGWMKHRCSPNDAERACKCPIGWEGYRAYHYPAKLITSLPDSATDWLLATLFKMESANSESLSPSQGMILALVNDLDTLDRDEILLLFSKGESGKGIRDVKFGLRRRKPLLIRGDWSQLGPWA
nr:MAG: RNA-dependent RNA polymerase [Hangzhou fiers-like virus 1]